MKLWWNWHLNFFSVELITTEEIMHVIDEYEIEFTHQNFTYIEKVSL